MGVMCKVRAQAFVMNVCIYIKLETNVLVSIGDSCIWAKTEGFSAQNTSPNLEEESKMSCDTQRTRSPATRQAKRKTPIN